MLNHTLISGFRALNPAISTFDHIALKVNYPSRCSVQPRSPAVAAAIAGDLRSVWFLGWNGISHLFILFGSEGQDDPTREYPLQIRAQLAPKIMADRR